MPESRRDYWVPKLAKNQVRDEINRALLEEQGWQVLVIWECEIKDHFALIKKIKRYLR
jgi:DNA mismatch endonuclease (patch repair protein)